MKPRISELMKPLNAPDSHHLRAAQGWLELGNHIEADEELERIAPQLRAHPDVLEVRWGIYSHAKNWDACEDIAQAMIKLAPKWSDGWILRSFALHQLRRTQEALDQLRAVSDRFPKVWAVPYNIAWYCARLDRMQESYEWLTKATTIDKHAVTRAATRRAGLDPLSDSMSGTLCKGRE